MKPFNLEEAKAGKPVRTWMSRHKVEIISFDDHQIPGSPILAKVFIKSQTPILFHFKEDGTHLSRNAFFLVMDEDLVEESSLWTSTCTEENTKINYIIKNE